MTAPPAPAPRQLALDVSAIRQHREALLGDAAELRSQARVVAPDAGRLSAATRAELDDVEVRATRLADRLVELADALAAWVRGVDEQDAAAGAAFRTLGPAS